jgi:lipopolysaccharide/colanic/teichoic acid biosynthesis glycosyltransferase
MGRRICEIALAGVALCLCAPIIAIAMAAIGLASPGPVIFRTSRVGHHGRLFTLYKLRTMHLTAAGLPVTQRDDPRVFRVGRWLRASKVDELPQLVNVLAGDMAIVGPRPEDPAIVAAHYTDAQRETLRVRPGLASPGSIYNYTHGEATLGGEAALDTYVRDLLPLKLALDLEYVRHASFWYDVRIVGRTVAVLAARACGRRQFRDPPELRRLQRHGVLVDEPVRVSTSVPPASC